MLQWVDCPSCQAAVPLVTDQAAHHNCPHCGQSLIAPSSSTDSKKTDGQGNVLGDLPPPRRVAERRAQTATEPIESPGDGVAEESPPAIQLDRAALLERGKRGHSSVWLWVLAAGAGVILTVALAWMLRPNAPLRDNSAAQLPAVTNADGLPAVASAENSDGAVNSDSNHSAPIAVDDWADLRLGSREDYFSLWNRIQPYLLRLDVKTLSGSRVAAAVLIDSRGLAATSFQAIRDAVSIEVRASSRSFSAGQPLGDLTDNVRGLVAVDEQRDVAILQVNRRFVSAFSTVSIPTNDPTLPGDRRVCANPPDEPHRIWLSDFAVRNVLAFRDLPAPIQSSLTEKGLDASDRLAWIVGESVHQRLRWGSPVFSFQGELMGLVTAASNPGEGIVTPASAIAAIIPQGGLSVREFPVDADVVEQLRAAAATNELLPSADSPARPLAHRLHTAMLALGQDLSDRPPDDRSAALATFASALLAVDEKLTDASLNETQTQELAVFAAAALDRFQSTLLTPDLIQCLSAEAPSLDLAEDPGGFVSLGRVVRVGHVESAGIPFVIFAVADPPQYLFTTIRHEGPIFLPGSRWILIGQSVPKTTHRSSDGVNLIEARVCDVHYVIALSALEPSNEDTGPK